jgi:hypothetical protein
MDKILGVDKTTVSPFINTRHSQNHAISQKKGNQAEMKPFTNFSVFHDNLIKRLKCPTIPIPDPTRLCRGIALPDREPNHTYRTPLPSDSQSWMLQPLRWLPRMRQLRDVLRLLSRLPTWLPQKMARA